MFTEKEEFGLQEIKILFQSFIQLKLFKPVWLTYAVYKSLFISGQDNKYTYMYETRKNRNKIGLKKFKLKTNQAMTNVS